MTNAEIVNQLEINPTQEDYVSLPIEEAFAWDDIIQTVKVQRSLGASSLYLVAFRSTLKEGVDSSLLLEHDRRAHDAALESPALIHYFGGTPNALGQALSFCLWENADDAKAVSRDKRHADATKMVSFYDRYSIEKYDIHHADGEVRLVASQDRILWQNKQ